MSEPLERIVCLASTNPQWRELPNTERHDDNLNKSWHLFELRACRVPRSLVFETQTCSSSTEFASVHSLLLNARALSAATGDMALPDPVPNTGVHAFPDRVVWEWGVCADGNVLRIAIRTRSSVKRERIGRGGRLRVVCRAEDDAIKSAASGVNGKGLPWETKSRYLNVVLLQRIQADFAAFCDNNVNRFLSGERVPADLHRRYERVSDMLRYGRMPDAQAAFAARRLTGSGRGCGTVDMNPNGGDNDEQPPAAPAVFAPLFFEGLDFGGHAPVPTGHADDGLNFLVLDDVGDDDLFYGLDFALLDDAGQEPLHDDTDGLEAFGVLDLRSLGPHDDQVQVASTCNNDSPEGPRGLKRELPPAFDLDADAHQRKRKVLGTLSLVDAAASK